MVCLIATLNNLKRELACLYHYVITIGQFYLRLIVKGVAAHITAGQTVQLNLIIGSVEGEGSGLGCI